MRRSTRTSFFWPMRCARSCACISWCGFQSLSKMMTVSAVWRFNPRPPARVLRMNKKYSEPGRLKSANRAPRSSAFVVPSKRRYLKRKANPSMSDLHVTNNWRNNSTASHPSTVPFSINWLLDSLIESYIMIQVSHWLIDWLPLHLIHSFTRSSLDWLIDWLFIWSIGLLVLRLIDWLIYWLLIWSIRLLVLRLIDWLTLNLIHSFTRSSIDWLIDSSFDPFVYSFFAWLIDWLIDSSFDPFVYSFFDWLIDWLIDS